ncbi:MAG: SUMF1/EgtB/PvdO family nonheme iron enzyme, partial [Candidatus ainarchaeum sp.]|nr:SUMF1/EgtB/PvdO family nonheme iron enzyme [Candidatus ainarchaeum sp.]
MNRNKSKNIFKKKSISPLIATILLVVVAVVLIAVVLTWGKTFTKESLDKTTDFADLKPSDAAFFLKVEDGLNGRFFAKFNPPTNTIKQITITGYSLLDTPRVPLDPPVTIKAYERLPLDLGIVHSPFDLVLYLDDDTIITKTGMKTTNRQPRNCPEGFIPVPGNFLYDTTNDSSMGFCVAKYEMKVDQNGDGIGDSNTDCQDSSYGVWKNDKAGCSYSDFNLVSSPEGYPLTDIKQTESIAACESIGGHLITNNEWMTLARNIEQVPSNWSSGTIGEGYLPRGNTNLGRAGSSPDPEGTGNNKRTLSLTNGEVIWDLAGNVWEWTNDNIDMSVNRPKSFNENGDEITTNGYYNYSFKASDP